MVRANYRDRFFFLFFFSYFFSFFFESRLLIVSIGANAHLCSSHDPRYNEHSAGMKTLSSKTSNYSPSRDPQAKTR